MQYKIYTDGGCWPNPGNGAYAWVIIDSKDNIVHEECVSVIETTNNRMEMMAILESLKYLRKRNMKLEMLYTDSQYCQKGIKDWMPKWKKKNWKNSAGEPVCNQDIWIEIDKVTTPKTKISFVKGHSGNKWNEYVDKLCSEKVSSMNSDDKASLIKYSSKEREFEANILNNL